MVINLWVVIETTRYLVLHVFTKPQAKVEWWDFADAFQDGDQTVVTPELLHRFPRQTFLCV